MVYFPKNVMDLIFQFDPTYYLLFDTCLIQLKLFFDLNNYYKDYENSFGFFIDKVFYVKPKVLDTL